MVAMWVSAVATMSMFWGCLALKSAPGENQWPGGIAGLNPGAPWMDARLKAIGPGAGATATTIHRLDDGPPNLVWGADKSKTFAAAGASQGDLKAGAFTATGEGPFEKHKLFAAGYTGLRLPTQAGIPEANFAVGTSRERPDGSLDLGAVVPNSAGGANYAQTRVRLRHVDPDSPPAWTQPLRQAPR